MLTDDSKKAPGVAKSIPYNRNLSVVVPIHNEAGNIRPLVEEIVSALRSRVNNFEIIYVDDASSDDSLAELDDLKRSIDELRVLRHDRQCGQSTALCSGVLHARYEWIATLDGDGQNDPADIPVLLDRLAQNNTLHLLAGWRVQRNDSWLRRLSSKSANGIRSTLLRDSTPDTGCGLKLFDRAMFLRLPYFDHMHRFLPALVQRAGGEMESVPVNHRPRVRGTSKYGVLNRLWVGIVDLFGVMWLIRRAHTPKVSEVSNR